MSTNEPDQPLAGTVHNIHYHIDDIGEIALAEKTPREADTGESLLKAKNNPLLFNIIQ